MMNTTCLDVRHTIVGHVARMSNRRKRRNGDEKSRSTQRWIPQTVIIRARKIVHSHMNLAELYLTLGDVRIHFKIPRLNRRSFILRSFFTYLAYLCVFLF